MRTWQLGLCLITGFIGVAPLWAAPAEPPVAGPPPKPAFGEGAAQATFLEAFPKLKAYTFKEPGSGFYLGFGASPVGVLSSRYMFSFDFFQVHYITERLNFEVFNASYGVTQAQSPTYQSRNFTFRTSPKIRFGHIFSLGPLAGYEFISFPNAGVRLYKDPWISPNEPFSSKGFIYGAEVSEIFHYSETYFIQVNQVIYQQNYSTEKTTEDWRYIYDSPELQADSKLIGASLVMMISVSFLY